MKQKWDENALAFIELCQAKKVKIPPKMLLGLERREPTLALSYEDIKGRNEENIQALLFNIAVYLKANPEHLKELIIDSVDIPSSLMNTYSVALQKNTSLEQLRLSHCEITDEGLLALCIGLQSNSKITLLDLSGNHITSNGFECLVDCLEYGLPLVYLDLHENDIEEFSVSEFIKQWFCCGVKRIGNLWKLLDAVEGNKSLVELCADQEIELSSPKLLYKLCEFLLNNKSLQKLSLGISIPSSIV